MASKKKPIDPDNIDLLGKKSAARDLSKYAEQAGADAVPLLERAFRSGSVDVRDAAALALATLDARRLERLARDALAALDKKAKRKELLALLKCLALSGTPSAIADLAERARTQDLATVLPPTVLVKLWRVVAPQLAGIDEDTAKFWLEHLGLPYTTASAPPDDATEILCGIIDSPLPALRKADAARHLHVRAAEHMPAYVALGARIDVPGVPALLAVDALLRSEPTHAYEVLAPRFRQDPAVRPLVARLIDAQADARWVGEAEALLDSELRATSAASTVLLRVGGERARTLLLARAEASNVLDEATREILHALGAAGEVRVAPLLLRWLNDAQGEAVAPMLLAALGPSGRASDIADIERAAVRQPARAAFFVQCIALIRARST